MLYKFGFENNFLGVKFITNNFMKQQFTFLNFAQVAYNGLCALLKILHLKASNECVYGKSRVVTDNTGQGSDANSTACHLWAISVRETLKG